MHLAFPYMGWLATFNILFRVLPWNKIDFRLTDKESPTHPTFFEMHQNTITMQNFGFLRRFRNFTGSYFFFIQAAATYTHTFGLANNSLLSQFLGNKQ